jgi:hypothetical protein
VQDTPRKSSSGNGNANARLTESKWQLGDSRHFLQHIALDEVGGRNS